jgi:hypothetical protein
MARRDVKKADTSGDAQGQDGMAAAPANNYGGQPASTVGNPNTGNNRFVSLGATGLRQFSGYVREEWLRELIDIRGLRMLREMRDNDPTIGAFFYAINMLLRNVRFHVEPETADDENDRAAADFVTSAYGDTEQSFGDLIADALTSLVFGYSVCEIVYKIRGGPVATEPKYRSQFEDGMIGWRKFASRSQESLLRWTFNDAGDAIEMVQVLPTGGIVCVPLAKAVHYRTDKQKNSPSGRSILRNCYTSYYFKKRLQQIEAVGIERDLVGIPVASVPPELLNANGTEEQKAQLAAIKAIVRDTARNEQEGIVWPLAYTTVDESSTPVPMFKLELLSSGGKRQIDVSQSISRYDKAIASTILADFIMLGDGKGSYALARNKTDMFTIAITGFLEIFTDEHNRKAIPDLLVMNGLQGRCRLVHGDIARRDLTELGQFLSQTALAGLLTPDDSLEGALREEASLPAMTTEGLRSVTGGAEDGDGPTDPTQPKIPQPGQRQTRPRLAPPPRA